MKIFPLAVAVRFVIALEDTSTIEGRPASSRCVRDLGVKALLEDETERHGGDGPCIRCGRGRVTFGKWRGWRWFRLYLDLIKGVVVDLLPKPPMAIAADCMFG